MMTTARMSTSRRWTVTMEELLKGLDRPVCTMATVMMMTRSGLSMSPTRWCLLRLQLPPRWQQHQRPRIRGEGRGDACCGRH